MGSISAASLLLLLAAVPAILAVTFQVGDISGWNSGVDYTTWVSGKTFRVGDTLEFQYGPFHSVSVVDKAGFDGCDSSRATQSFSDGDTKIDLTTVGTMHFLCPTPGHCLGGMKLSVPVLASSPTTSSPPPSPLTPPPSPRTPPSSTPSPPPSPRTPPPSTPSPPPSPQTPPSSTPSPPLSPHSPHKPKTPPPSASPPANGTPESKSSTPPTSPSTPSPSPLTPSPSPSPSNAASKGVMSYGVIGMTIVMFMYGVMS